jgi:hypothetical protein
VRAPKRIREGRITKVPSARDNETLPWAKNAVKLRRADGIARERVWESTSLPALIKAVERNLDGLFL